jgi:hypothetical protein
LHRQTQAHKRQPLRAEALWIHQLPASQNDRERTFRNVCVLLSLYRCVEGFEFFLDRTVTDHSCSCTKISRPHRADPFPVSRTRIRPQEHRRNDHRRATDRTAPPSCKSPYPFYHRGLTDVESRTKKSRQAVSNANESEKIAWQPCRARTMRRLCGLKVSQRS